MNIKGISLFCGLSFLLLGGALFILHVEGLLSLSAPNPFQYILVAALMGIPALSALAAYYCFPDDEPFALTLWPVPRREGTLAVLAAPVLFAVSYLVARVFGLTFPQWGLGGLINRATADLGAPLEPGVASAAPVVALVVYPLLSVLAGATLFAVLAVGGEVGWRAYLAPRLAPLGALPAAIVTGLLWGLWFLPWVYAWSREVGLEMSAATALRGISAAVVLSILLSAVFRRRAHLGITALWLGGFVGQTYGIWPHLFEQDTPPWTGPYGWINIMVWGAVALVLHQRWMPRVDG